MNYFGIKKVMLSNNLFLDLLSSLVCKSFCKNVHMFLSSSQKIQKDVYTNFIYELFKK